MDEEEERHKRDFEKFCYETFLCNVAAGSKTIGRDKGERIVKMLKYGDDGDEPAKFKHWVKTRRFCLMSYPALGLVDVLCLPAKSENTNDTTILGRWRKVAFVEDFFQVIHDVHATSKGHIGVKKTVDEVGKIYECVPRSAIDKYVSLCLVCHLRKPQTTRALLKPIISSGFMTRGQIDLIDMRHRPDGIYKWIGHFMDHWSKFHVLFALSRKTAAEVALNLQNLVFSYLGTPKILHSDNGREFVNEIVESVVKDWPGDVTIVNGRPRNPKCQGLIEQGNSTVEKLLGIRLLEAKADDYPTWSEWLPLIQYQLNTTTHGTVKTTPYELVFGQPPRQCIFPTVDKPCILEEHIEDILEDNEDLLSSGNVSGDDDDKDIDDKDEEEMPPSSPQLDDSIQLHHGDSAISNLSISYCRSVNEDRENVPCSNSSDKNCSGSDDENLSCDDDVEDRHLGNTLVTSSSENEDDDNSSIQSPPQVRILSTSTKHKEIREKADARYLQNAQRMKLKYAKGKRRKVHTFAVGDFVGVRVPKLDRSSTDSHRLMCVVVQKLGKKYHLYRLRCEDGVLKNCFGEGDLELYEGQLNLAENWESEPVLSLREAAMKANPQNDFKAGRCNCKKGCHENSCRCKKQGAPCTSKCHHGRSCHNQPDSADKVNSSNTAILHTSNSFDTSPPSCQPVQLINQSTTSKNRELLLRQLYDKFNYRVWSTGACYNAFDSAVDEDTDLTPYLNEGEFGLNIDTDVLLWQESRSYEHLPPLKVLDHFGFVVVNDELHEEFERFKQVHVPLGSSILQVIHLLKLWLLRNKELSSYQLFGSPHVRLTSDQVDNLIEWISHLRSEVDKQGESVIDSLALQLDETESCETNSAQVMHMVNSRCEKPAMQGHDGRKRRRCGRCAGCKTKDCGKCKNCKDKPKFGGPGKRKQSCLDKKCIEMETVAQEPLKKKPKLTTREVCSYKQYVATLASYCKPAFTLKTKRKSIIPRELPGYLWQFQT